MISLSLPKQTQKGVCEARMEKTKYFAISQGRTRLTLESALDNPAQKL